MHYTTTNCAVLLCAASALVRGERERGQQLWRRLIIAAAAASEASTVPFEKQYYKSDPNRQTGGR